MTEMKTLKDMPKCPDCKRHSCEDNCKCVQFHPLRQSAIEDIKEFKKQQQTCQHGDACYMPACLECQHKLIGKIKYIKRKFNITEEDLK